MKGKLCSKFFQSFLRILFFTEQLLSKQGEEEVTAQWIILLPLTATSFMLSFISIKTLKFKLMRNCDPCLFQFEWQKNVSQRIHLQWAHEFLIISMCRCYSPKSKPLCFGRLTVWSTCHSMPLISPVEFRRKDKPFFPNSTCILAQNLFLNTLVFEDIGTLIRSWNCKSGYTSSCTSDLPHQLCKGFKQKIPRMSFLPLEICTILGLVTLYSIATWKQCAVFFPVQTVVFILLKVGMLLLQVVNIFLRCQYCCYEA